MTYRFLISVWGLFLFGAASVRCEAANPSAGEVSGIVFEDLNKNRMFDPGEKGIPNVLVSNQTDVAATDELGHYTLPVPDDETVFFVIKPPQYSLPRDENNLPRFYSIHQPNGSPKTQFAGVEPTGNLPESLNFPLDPAPSGSVFDVVVFGDPQPSSHEQIGFIRDDVVSELVGSDAVFSLTLGDNVFDDLSLYDHYIRVMASIGNPVFNVPGNHDQNYDVPDDRHSLETFKKTFGPPYYAFEQGMVHFIVLDSVTWIGKTETEKGHYIGQLGEEQSRWIENYLRHVPEDHLIVFAMHIPFVYSQDSSDSLNITDREKLFEIVKDRKHVVALAGHMHLFEQIKMDEKAGRREGAPFPQITHSAVCGSWWSGPADERGIPVTTQADGAPNGYYIYTFKGNQFSQRFKAANFDDAYQFRISEPPSRIPQAQLSGRSVIVNVFNGSEESLVEFRLDNQAPVRMEQTVMVDPFTIGYHETYKKIIPEWVEAAKNPHMWTAPLPEDLQPGIHTLTVRTVDAYGQEYKQSKVFEVE